VSLPDPERRTTGSPSETEALGGELARHLGAGDVVLLFGELGSGKTCLVKGIARGLGIDPDRVHSPTFIMVNRHQGRVPLHHVDLYRLRAGEDISDLGLADLFAGEGVTAVEWAERLSEAALPLPRLEVRLAHAGGERRSIEIRPVLSAP
jgi:tRNA threonylcarbamoyladenosine biosynthesis protein TsaE